MTWAMSRAVLTVSITFPTIPPLAAAGSPSSSGINIPDSVLRIPAGSVARLPVDVDFLSPPLAGLDKTSAALGGADRLKEKLSPSSDSSSLWSSPSSSSSSSAAAAAGGGGPGGGGGRGGAGGGGGE